MESKKLKASLAWNLSDYLSAKEEPPPYVLEGTTEGEVLEDNEVERWCTESVQMLSIFREEYPDMFNKHLEIFHLDLDYLLALGKITIDENEKLKTKEIFNFGKE